MKIITCQNVEMDAEKIKNIDKFDLDKEFCLSVSFKNSNDIKEFYFDSHIQREITYQLLIHEIPLLDTK